MKARNSNAHMGEQFQYCWSKPSTSNLTYRFGLEF
jgi:hypothetical protein